MNPRLTSLLVAGLAVAAIGMTPAIAAAKHGTDDPAGHVSHQSRGADDSPARTAASRGRGADDAAGHTRRGHGADDGPTHR